MNFDFKVGNIKRRSFDETETRYLRHHTWVAIGVGVAGAAASVYGANKQAKSNKEAQASNAALQGDQNQSAWASYLLSRGVNPTGAQTGQLPSNPQAVNTRLPLWASVKRTPQAAAGFRLSGMKPSGPKLSMTPSFQNTNAADQAAAAAAAVPQDKGSSKMNDILIGNPLGIGGKDRSFFDPLGIF